MCRPPIRHLIRGCSSSGGTWPNSMVVAWRCMTADAELPADACCQVVPDFVPGKA